ncbi:uncharacterized protein AMSG_10497 [Thecamonas trahens ATCC 50062]|uniref:Uncharacterized protein n=1 Tax=Thecamonas trahens ATCC 50062 TaxID=461836 RepID=A0A0L0DQA9_THETB|nr:hypothetical protein AMSG_10497 [Thecamonas trahens ATCC 50062]KNC54499.1 hypothetical protein AMSG_10497 [Thecamonas trahens ATCC 50062]|eukprot:XP_013753652.1 hypothetical protein AMSG_10497 [Thecamonas trahens ATCC 50062]
MDLSKLFFAPPDTVAGEALARASAAMCDGGGYGRGRTIVFSDPSTRLGLSLGLQYALSMAGASPATRIHWLTSSRNSHAPFGPVLPFRDSLLARAHDQPADLGHDHDLDRDHDHDHDHDQLPVPEKELPAPDAVPTSDLLARIGLKYLSSAADLRRYAAHLHELPDDELPAVIIVDSLLDLIPAGDASHADDLARTIALLADAAEHVGDRILRPGASAHILLLESLADTARISASRAYPLPPELFLVQHWIDTVAVAAGGPPGMHFVFSVVDFNGHPDPLAFEVELDALLHPAVGPAALCVSAVSCTPAASA